MAKFPLSASGSVTFTNEVGYLSVDGYQTAFVSGAAHGVRTPGGTIDELYVNVTAFSTSNSPTVTARRDLAGTSVTVTLTGTGEFRDASNTASVAGGQITAYADNTAGAMGDAITVETRKLYFAPTSGNTHIIGGTIVNACDYANHAQTVYVPPLNDLALETTTESDAAQNLVTAQNLSALYVYATVASGSPTATTRKNSANTSQTVTMTAAGLFSDITNTVSVAPNDDIDLAAFIPCLFVQTVLQGAFWALSVGATMSGILLSREIMMGDVVDEDEIKTGLRREGSYFGAFGAIEKISFLIIPMSIAVIFQFVGYGSSNPNHELINIGFRIGIVTCTSIFSIIMLIFLWMYPLGKEKASIISQEIQKLHAEKVKKIKNETN